MEGSGRGRGGPRSLGGGDGRGGGRGRSQYYRGGGGDGGGRGVQYLQGGGGDGDFGGGTGRGSRAGQQKRFYRQSTSGGYGGCGGSGDCSPDLWQRSAQPYTQQSPGGGGRVGSGRSRGYGGGGGRGSSSSYHQQARHLRGNPESGGVSSVRDSGPGEISVGGRGYLTGGGEGSSARSSCGSWGQAPQPAAPGCTRLRFGGCGGVKPRWYTSVEVSDKVIERGLDFLFVCISFIVSKVIHRQ